MSLEAMVSVFRDSQAEGGARLSLLSLARFADETSCSCPSVGTIAADSKQSRSGVQKQLRKLATDGEITAVGTSDKYGTTIYRIEVAAAAWNTPEQGGQPRRPPPTSDAESGSSRPEGVVTPSANTDDGQNNGSGLRLAVDAPTEFESFIADYREVTGRPQTKGSTAAMKLFAARRAEGFTLDELRLATRGAHGDEWMVKNGRDVPETILRGDKLTRYITLARESGLDPAAVEKRSEQGVPQVSFDGGATWETDWELIR